MIPLNWIVSVYIWYHLSNNYVKECSEDCWYHGGVQWRLLIHRPWSSSKAQERHRVTATRTRTVSWLCQDEQGGHKGHEVVVKYSLSADNTGGMKNTRRKPSKTGARSSPDSSNTALGVSASTVPKRRWLLEGLHKVKRHLYPTYRRQLDQKTQSESGGLENQSVKATMN